MQHQLKANAKAGMVIDGQPIAVGTGHTIDNIRRLIGLRSPTRH